MIAAGTAQTDPAAGILPFSTHVGGTYDSIDLATSAILIDIPVRAKVGKIPLNFSLVANNHIFKSCGGNYCTPHLSASMAGRSSAADLDVAAFVPTHASKQEGTCNGHSSNFLYSSWVITTEPEQRTRSQSPWKSISGVAIRRPRSVVRQTVPAIHWSLQRVPITQSMTAPGIKLILQE